jgi:[acyl-carrier-protein] S-malonyltransferase
MSKHAYVFPGQGSQFSGMGKNLYEQNETAKALFEKANEILGFRISDIMFEGTDEQLKQTNVTQPAVFIHSVIAYLTMPEVTPDMVAGHSLGEFSALVLADDKVVEICASVSAEFGEVVVAANYNCPGQLVISGSVKGIEIACEQMKAAGAKRALVLPVGGAFHSPLMEPAKIELAAAINATTFNTPICPVYQNVVAKAVTDPADIKANLISQLTGAVKWTQTIQNMVEDGATQFTEVGPGKVLQGLVQKIHKEAIVQGVQ